MSDTDSRPSASRHQILLVDDTEINRDIIGHLLTKAGFLVDIARNGDEAIAMTWQKAYDLVLMDIEMPGMDGYEASARIRVREGVMSGVKIAALTATTQPDAEQVSFWSGIDAFVAKPIEPALLVQKVSELVAGGASDGNDWKPVWRLGVFARITDQLDHEDAAGYLDEFAGLLDSAATAIDGKLSFSGDFHRTIDELLNLATLLGFEEIAGLCAHYRESRGKADRRCRDPNLIGAICRARYAIDVYEKEQKAAPLADWRSRMRVNVQSLLRAKLRPAPAEPVTY